MTPVPTDNSVREPDPERLPVSFAPGKIMVGDGVNRGFEGPGTLPPPERELPGDQGVLALLEEQEIVRPFANDHWPSLASWQRAAFGSLSAGGKARTMYGEPPRVAPTRRDMLRSEGF